MGVELLGIRIKTMNAMWFSGGGAGVIAWVEIERFVESLLYGGAIFITSYPDVADRMVPFLSGFLPRSLPRQLHSALRSRIVSCLGSP